MSGLAACRSSAQVQCPKNAEDFQYLGLRGGYAHDIERTAFFGEQHFVGRLLTLQVARGAAANLVVLSHLWSVSNKYTGGVLPTCAFYGVAGVDLFFVLSGFIMVAIAGNSISPAQFLWRRAVRILPSYWLITTVVLCVSLVAPAMVNSSVTAPISIWRSFLLIPQEPPPLLAVGWTLIHEAYFYLVFAALLFLRMPIVTGLTLWIGCLVGLSLICRGDASPVMHVITSPLTAEFMMGALVGVLYRQALVPLGALATGIGVTALAADVVWTAPALSLVSQPNLNLWRVFLFGLPAAFIIYGLAARELHTSPRPHALLVTVGDISYATYLVHVLVLSAIGRLLELMISPGIGATCVLVLVGIPAVNFVGALVYRLFERPSIAILNDTQRAFLIGVALKVRRRRAA